MDSCKPLVIRGDDPLDPFLNVGFVVLALCITCFGIGYWRFSSARGLGPLWPIYLCAASTVAALATCGALTALRIIFASSV